MEQSSSPVQDQLSNVQQVQANKGAFAGILKYGSIVTWGHPEFGADSSAQDQLRSVQQVQAAERAFAAILEGGSIVTWGSIRWWRQLFRPRSAEGC